MRPRDPHFSYKFLDGHKPIQVGYFQQPSSSNCFEFAVYTWSGNCNETVRIVQAELPDFAMKNHPPEWVEFVAKNGTFVELQAVRLTKGKLTKHDIPDQNSVTVLIARLLPEDSYTELRVRYFGTNFFEE